MSYSLRTNTSLGYLLHAGRWSAFLWLFLCGISGTAQATVSYAYDEAGRLVQVVDPSGNSAQYQYDSVGNITAIRRYVAGDVSIAEFTPDSGAVGATVTIYGVGFSATASSNTVKFNGVAATVNAATANSITTAVPTTATTGPITVNVGTKTATSVTPFNVTFVSTNGIPVIGAFSPTVAAQGAVVTITGNNFDPTTTKNSVKFNITSATVTGSTLQQIKTSVPTGASSGPIQVRTAAGSTTSNSDFFVVPVGYSSNQIGVAKRINVNSNALSIVTGKIAMVVFNGIQGQTLGLGISPVSFSPAGGGATLYIRTPDGNDLGGPWGFSSASNWDLPALPKTGNYTLLIMPYNGYAINATLTLSTSATGVLMANGSAKSFISTRAGQNARYTFGGTTGQNFGLALSGDLFPGYTYIYVYKPDGSQLNYTYLYYPGSGTSSVGAQDLGSLPVTGTYTVFIAPTGAATGAISMALWPDAVGVLAVDGAAATGNLAQSRKGRYMFSGTTGQNLTLSATELTNQMYVTVYSPDGSLLQDCIWFYQNNGGGNCDLPGLPTTGTYMVLVSPSADGYARGANFNLWLSNDVTGTLTSGAAAQTFTARPGQLARYTFSATSGQSFSLLFGGDTIAGDTYCYVYNPDGSQVGSTYLHPSVSSSSILNLINLPATGTYTVLVDPPAIATGTISVALSSYSNTLVVDGAAASSSLPLSGLVQFTFAGKAGQNLGLVFSDLTPYYDWGLGGYVTVTNPDGSLLLDGGWLPSSGGGRWDLPKLLTTGTYKITVDSSGNWWVGNAFFRVWLSSNVTGTLNSGVTSTFTSTRVGQNARYSFSGTINQSISLNLDGDLFPGDTYLYLYAPDGSEVTHTVLTYSGGTASSQVWNLTNLPATGTYTVLVLPAVTAVGSISIIPWPDTVGTVTVDGTATGANILAGRKGRFTFTGSAGLNLGLGLSNLVSTPANNTVWFAVYAPDGSLFADCGVAYQALGGDCDLPQLPASGIYTILVDSTGPWAATFKLWLSKDVSIGLGNGLTKTFTTARPGQNARCTLNSTTVGQNQSVVLNGNSFPGSTTVTVFNPDGSVFNSLNLDYSSDTSITAVLDLSYLPTIGTYTVLISPTGEATGAVTMIMWPDVTSTLNINGGTTGVSLPQNRRGRYTFYGAVGQHLGLGITNLTTTPTGNQISIAVYAPDNSLLLDGATLAQSAGSGGYDLPVLTTAGTYTLLVDTSGNWTTSMVLWLSSDIVDGMVANAAKTFTSNRPGQNASYIFSGNAGQNLTLTLSGDVFPGYTYVYVSAPDGSQLAYTGLSYSSGTGSSTTLALNNLPTTGNYTIFVTPSGAATGSMTLKLQ